MGASLKMFTRPKNAAFAGILGNLTEDIYLSTSERVRASTRSYVCKGLKGDVLKHNLSGWTFVYQESYEQWLEKELNRIINTLLFNYIIEAVKVEMSQALQDRLSADKLLASQLLSFADSSDPAATTLMNKMEDQANSAEIVSTMLIFGIGLALLPVTATVAPWAGLAAGVINGWGVIGSASAAVVAGMALPLLHLGGTYAVNAAVVTAIRTGIAMNEAATASWWWTSSDIRENALDCIVSNLLGSFDSWYLPIKNEIDKVMEESIATMSGSFMERSELFQSCISEIQEDDSLQGSIIL